MFPFYLLSDSHAETPHLAGYKAGYLATLMRQGYRGVPGFVVGIPLWRQFVAQVNWGEPLIDGLPSTALNVNVDDSHQLQSAAQRLQQAIMAQPFPPAWRSPLEAHIAALQTTTVILRPSIALSTGADPATVPTTGLIQSGLAATNLDAVINGIKAFWAQLFRAKSLFYWQRRGISLADVRLAVLMQPLKPAVASGRLDISGHDLCLSSVHGLGYALTLGEAMPEQYYLNGETGQTQIVSGRQAYGYWLQPSSDIVTSPTDSKQVPEVALSPHADGISVLLHQPVPSRLLQDGMGVISPSQRQQLVTLGHTLAARWLPSLGAAAAQQRPHLQIEWILCRDRHQNETVYVTQVAPYPGPSMVYPAAAAEQQGRSQHTAPPPVSPESQRQGSGQQQSSETTVIQGLGASPGQVSGRLHRVESPRDQVPPNAILLAVNVTPDWMPLIQRTMGVIAEQGGMTSHAAILTRELGIPAVVGVAHATQRLRSGDRVMIDGDRGIVTLLLAADASHPDIQRDIQPVTQPRRTARLAGSTVDKQSPAALNLTGSPVVNPLREDEYRIRPRGNFCSLSPSHKTETKLMLTLSNVDQLYSITNIPIDGIGLLRSELLLLPLLNNQHPLQWLASGRQEQLVSRIAASVSQLAAAVFPDPVFYRTLNLCTDEFSHLEGAPSAHERNPALGEHGAYSYGIYPDLFKAELLALRRVQQAGYSNLRMLLPFVRSVDEVVYAQQLIQRAELHQVESFQLWIMAEVPSVLFLLPEYATLGVQGIAIGSNDLTQLLFAADRNNPTLSSRFHAHPVVMQAIRQLVTQANELGIGSCLCGDLPGYHPDIISDLIAWGIGAISVPPATAATVRQAIAAAEDSKLSSH